MEAIVNLIVIHSLRNDLSEYLELRLIMELFLTLTKQYTPNGPGQGPIFVQTFILVYIVNNNPLLIMRKFPLTLTL